jgi:hypothetical protein
MLTWICVNVHILLLYFFLVVIFFILLHNYTNKCVILFFQYLCFSIIIFLYFMCLFFFWNWVDSSINCTNLNEFFHLYASIEESITNNTSRFYRDMRFVIVWNYPENTIVYSLYVIGVTFYLKEWFINKTVKIFFEFLLLFLIFIFIGIFINYLSVIGCVSLSYFIIGPGVVAI